MKWFRKQTAPAGASVQLRETGHHPFGLLGQYVPMRSGEIRLYRAVREAVPVVDAAIYKLIRMVGGVTAACSDPAAERGLGEFLRTVPVNCTQENGHDGFDPRPRLVDTHLTHRVRGTSSVIK